MKSGFRLLLFFAAAWGVAALLSLGARGGLLLLPPLLSLVLAYAGRKALHRAKPSAETRHRTRRIVRLWSVIEVILIAAALFLLNRFDAQRLIAPVISVIVGLHFLPLAHGLARPLYYGTGGMLVLAGLVAVWLPPGIAPAVAACGGALILWGTATAMLWTASIRASAGP